MMMEQQQQQGIAKECLDTMESLVDKFGRTCRFALEVAYSKKEIKRRQQGKAASRNDDDITYVMKDFTWKGQAGPNTDGRDHRMTVLAYFYAENRTEPLNEFSIPRVLDEDEEEAILLTFSHYNKMRLDRLKDNNNTQGSDAHGRWKQLRLGSSIESPSSSRILEHPSMELFQGVCIGKPSFKKMRVSSGLMLTLRKLYARGKHDTLQIFNLSLSAEDAIHLGEIIGSNCLREVVFSHLWFGNSMEYIRQGLHQLEALPSNNETNSARLKKMTIAFELQADEDEATRLLASLGRLRSLKELDLSSPFEAPIAQALVQDVISSPTCCIEKLSLCWVTYLSLNLREHPAMWEALCRAVESNHNIRDFDLTAADISNDHTTPMPSLFLMIMSSNCTLRQFCSKHPLMPGLRWSDLPPFIGDGPPSNQRPSQVRRVDFGIMYCFSEFIHDIQIVLHMVSNCLPYVYDLMDMVPGWGSLNRRMDEHMKNNTLDTEADSDVRMLQVWLERNQVGRALLLPAVAPTVPMGLWSIVLEKAANSRSVLFKDDKERRRPPVDGIFFVIQGLVHQGGGLGSNSNADVEVVLTRSREPQIEQASKRPRLN